MSSKNIVLKAKAISLRKIGNTYSEILKEIPVAKSTLSLWLRSVGLSKKQEQIFSEKRREGSLKGAMRKKEIKLNRILEIGNRAENEIKKISKREKWLVGVALYWAEGSKEKEYRPGSGVAFTNSDSKMVQVFLNWLIEVCEVSKKRIIFEIYIHDSYKNEINRLKKFWSSKTGFSEDCFNRIYFKRNKIETKRKNRGGLYNGVLRVKVLGSSDLCREIAGWTNGIINNWGVV